MDQKPYPAEKARGGEIILDAPWRHAVFLAGLIGDLPHHHYDAGPLTLMMWFR